MKNIEKYVVWLTFAATAAALVLTEYAKTVELLNGEKKPESTGVAELKTN